MRQLRTLRELRKRLGAEVFLVGGTVRDLVRHKTPNDIDVLVRQIAPADFEEFLRKRGKLRLVGKSFGVYLFQPKGSDTTIEIAFPRKEISTGDGHRDFEVQCNPNISIQEDSNRRDFTCNAMYLNLDDVSENGEFDPNVVIDFHNGLEHIRRRLVVAVGNPEERILEDPLRMLRAVVLIARTGWRLEGNTFGAIKKSVDLLSSISPERIRDEVIKIMGSDKPSRAFKTMHRCGLLRLVIPELDACVGLGQNPKYHSFNIFDHLIYATDASCQISDRLDVRFATLCHDLGKAPTREIRPGGAGPNDVSFHNHEVVSTKLTFSFLSRLRFPTQFVQDVIHLVRHHQYKYDRTWTDRAVRRFIKKANITREDLKDLDNHPQFLVRQADRMGNEFKAHLPITVKQKDFQKRIIEIYESSSAHSLRDLKVSGKDIMSELGLSSSPLVGDTIKYLFDLVEGTPALNNREDLLREAREFVKEAQRGNNSAEQRSSRQSSRASTG